MPVTDPTLDPSVRILRLREAVRYHDLRAWFYGRRYAQTGRPSYAALREEAELAGDIGRAEIADIIREHGPWASMGCPLV
ncbi:hypothetical protein [Actinomyces howellii]|uniref:Uncharacterized protein n=1 Tax=Actinomyces howellii TaxID=52771 RepID=A0A3S4R3D1_9ACTO|nr:hypothetical protein [Actinomyces howellii]VEG28077.1 Uncharacterised protein [Actinomyces howellii]